MPRFNVAPAQTIPVVVEDAKTRRLKPMTWVSTAVNAVANNGPELVAPLREIVDPA